MVGPYGDLQTLGEIAETLRQRKRENRSYLLDQPVTSLETLLHAMSAMDIIVTCRFHRVLFAHLMNILVLALSHHPKVMTLMKPGAVRDQPLRRGLIATFNRMMADRHGIKARLAEQRITYKTQLSKQFDRLFTPADSCALQHAAENNVGV